MRKIVKKSSRSITPTQKNDENMGANTPENWWTKIPSMQKTKTPIE